MHFLECRGRDASLSSVGLLPLNTQIEVWISIMRLLMCRQIFLPQAIVLGLDSKECGTNDTATRAMILAEQSDCNLTVREWEVLELVASGLQNKMIAASLKLSEHTVKLHIHKVLRKLGVSNRTLATRWFHQVANGPKSIDGQPHA
ncbi:response regulator transcription factor [Salipiger sp. IMCC34102]|nr:response regulator transcription factor [Salipiger sp. IMCC34102]